MPKQLAVPLPSNFRVEQSSDELKIMIRWFTPKLWMPTLLCLFLDGLVSVFVVALIAGAPRMSGEDLGAFIIAPLILTPFILLGRALTYYVLAGYLNKTLTPFILIEENGGELREIRGNSEIPAVPLSSSKFLSSRVNWLARRTLFTFDEVEIVRATDEEVERFAVQAGNDTDPMRQTRYQAMACRVWPDCGLAENTMRILQRTFGQVEVGRR